MEDIVETAKERVKKYKPRSDKATIRLLNAFLEYLPTDGKKNLAYDILSFSSDEQIREKTESLRIGLLIPMTAKHKTESAIITPSERVNKPFETLADTCMKDACLARDGFKCTVTGRLDEEHVSEEDETSLIGATECAHIIPFSLAKWKDKPERRAKLHIWVTLRRYFPGVPNTFDHELINETYNGITMIDAIHGYFGQFEIAFQETETPNNYRLINHAPRKVAIPLPQHVTFVGHNGQFPLPSPQLLKIHAAIAQILHASGQAWDISKVLGDIDDTAVLAKDGGTDISALLSATSLGPLSMCQGSLSHASKEDPKPLGGAMGNEEAYDEDDDGSVMVSR